MGSRARWGLLVLFVVVVAWLTAASGMAERFKLAVLRDLFVEHPWQGTGLYILLFCIGGLLRIPGLVFLAAAVLALGPELGGVLTYLAALVSCSLSFLIVRAIGGDVLRQLEWPWVRRVLRQLDQRPVQSVVLLRSILFVTPPLNYALAVSGIRFRHYFFGTLLGLPLPVAVCSYFADWLIAAFRLTG